MHDTSKGVAFVTGCSSGIGLAFAERLARRGHDLIIVARRQDRLTQLAQRLERETGVGVEVLAADLADAGDLRRATDRLAAENNLTMLVNNAGLGGVQPFVDMTPAAITQMIGVNVLALTLLTHAALPRLIARRGTVINVGSGVSFATLQGAAVYGGTKGYVLQFSRTLHEEVGGLGVRVQALIPGLTRTNLGGAEEIGLFDRFPPEWVMAPADLVDASLVGLELGELVCVPALKEAGRVDATLGAMQELGAGAPSGEVAARYRRPSQSRSS